MAIKPRFIRFLDKGTGVVDQTQYPCPEEWTPNEVKKDIEKDVDFVQVLQVSHNPIAGLYGKIVESDPKFSPKDSVAKE